MRGTSEASRDAVLRGFDPVATAAGADGTTLADQLFTVVDALDGSGSLRRALTDPARDGAAKAALVNELFASFDERVRTVVSEFVTQRWSDEADLGDSIEAAGEAALLAQADADGSLGRVEEELFTIERRLETSRELLAALGDRSAAPQARAGVLEDVLGGKAADVTQALVLRKVVAPRGVQLLPAVKALVAAAAHRQTRLVARVTTAVEPTAAQRKRLASILASAYGREVQLNVAIDPAVVGGMKIQVGDEVVDGTVVSRLADARRRLVG